MKLEINKSEPKISKIVQLHMYSYDCIAIFFKIKTKKICFVLKNHQRAFKQLPIAFGISTAQKDHHSF